MVSTMTFYVLLVATVLASVAVHSSRASSELKVQSREKRQIVAREELLDPKEPKYQKLAEEAYRKYQETHLDGVYSINVILQNITRQLVNGYLYRLKFLVVKTYSGGNSNQLECNSKVWEMTDDGPKVISVDCIMENERQSGKKRLISGGQEVQNPKDPQYETLAKESYQKYLDTHESTVSRMAKNIVVTRATSQVVSGSMKRINFVVTTIYDEILKCHSKVWEQEWLHKKDIDVDCHVIEGLADAGH